jgi:hypothetical protein
MMILLRREWGIWDPDGTSSTSWIMIIELRYGAAEHIVSVSDPRNCRDSD